MTNWMAQFRGPLDSALVRCLAIVLVSNSHLDGLYPVPQLATGGALGNALFFAASGYGLALSYKSAPASFWAWYWQRLTRLYPAVIIVMGIFELGISHSWSPAHWTLSNYFEVFVWPTPAWFISAMLIFYAGFYPVIRLDNRAVYLWGLAILGALYAGAYVTQVDLTRYSIEKGTRFNWIFYFGLMLLGGILAARDSVSRAPQARDLWIAVCLLCAYFGFGYLLSRGYFTAYQFVMHLITVPLVVSVFGLSKSDWLKRNIGRSRIATGAVFLIAGVTLEIYLLQFYVYSHPAITSLPFPANVLAFWVVLVLLAWLVATAASWVRGLLKRQPGQIDQRRNDVR